MDTAFNLNPHLAQHDRQIQLSGSYNHLHQPTCCKKFSPLAFLFFLSPTAAPRLRVQVSDLGPLESVLFTGVVL
jgi:hypothetical protein